MWRFYVLLTILTMATSSLKFHIATYNVGSTLPDQKNIMELLGLNNDPDLICMGFEELGDNDAWEDEVDAILCKRDYYRVKLITMTLMQQVIFVKKKHISYLTHIETEYTKTGFGGTYGNKGGTSIRFRLYNKTVALVNSHLSAHMDNVQIRDEEYWNILKEQDFDDPLTEHLYDHDYVFWAGDLNYRIEHINSQVRDTIKKGKYLELLKYDQLKQEQLNGHAFIGFHEADITFPPTYKFDPGTDTYDTSEKNRTPSWCDRVLWRIKAEREEIVHALNWADCCSSDLSSGSESDEHDGGGSSKLRMKKKKKKETSKDDKQNTGSYEDLSEQTTYAKFRKETINLMKKTAAYGYSAGSALLRTATGTEQIKINSVDVADPERFKNLLNTLQREKVNKLVHKYETSVRPLSYKSYPHFRQSDHKPVSALLEVGVDMTAEPMVTFTAPSYTWFKKQKLEVSVRFSPEALISTWDWVGLLETNWTDANKHYITYEYLPSGKNNVKFPASAHPGKEKKLQVVFFSSKMSAPVALADVKCVLK